MFERLKETLDRRRIAKRFLEEIVRIKPLKWSKYNGCYERSSIYHRGYVINHGQIIVNVRHNASEGGSGSGLYKDLGYSLHIIKDGSGVEIVDGRVVKKLYDRIHAAHICRMKDTERQKANQEIEERKKGENIVWAELKSFVRR